MRTLTSALLLSLSSVTSAPAALIVYWSMNEKSGDLADSGLGSPPATAKLPAIHTGVLYAQKSVPAGIYGEIVVDEEAAKRFGTCIDLWESPEKLGRFAVSPANHLKIENFTPTDSFTVMAWVRPDAFNLSRAQRIVTASSSIQPRKGWGFGLTKDNQLIFTGYGLADNVQNLSTPLKAGEWHHIAMTYVSGTVTYYFDGKRLGSSKQAFEPQTSNFQVRIGGLNGGEDQFTGALDEVKIFNSALTVDGIRAAAIR